MTVHFGVYVLNKRRQIEKEARRNQKVSEEGTGIQEVTTALFQSNNTHFLLPHVIHKIFDHAIETFNFDRIFDAGHELTLRGYLLRPGRSQPLHRDLDGNLLGTFFGKSRRCCRLHQREAVHPGQKNPIFEKILANLIVG